MSTTADRAHWRTCFPLLADEGGAEVAAILDAAPVLRLKQGQIVFDSGSPCQNFLLVLEGSVCVQLLGENGRLITLYRVRAGGFCVLTTICLLGRQNHPAIGVAESPVTALALGPADFNRALEQSAGFRRFVFEGLGQRLAALIRRLESVTFGTIDQRLAATLCAASPVPGVVELTHEALAVELGTVREVVSRHIKRFEEVGWLKLMRGRIEILDPDALCRLAEASLCDPITELTRKNGDHLHQSN